MKNILFAALALLMGMSVYAQEKATAKSDSVLASVGVITADGTFTGDSELTYCGSGYGTSIGTGTPGSYYYEWAAVFRPSQYTADDNYVTSVDFYSVEAVTYTLKIYDSPADASAPSNVIYTKDYPVTETMTWVNLPINEIVAIDHSKALWVSLGTNEGSFPAAACSEELTTTDCCMFFISGNWMPVNMIGSYPLCPWMIVANTTSDTPGIDCTPVTEFPYFNDFENFPNEKDCWVSIDNDGDGHDWFTGTEAYWDEAFGYNGSQCLASESHSSSLGSLNADNYLLSSEFVLPTNKTITLSWLASRADDQGDHYEVMISPDGSTNINDFVSVFNEDSPWNYTERAVDLTEYAGNTVRIVFHHQDYNKCAVLIDNMGIETIADCSAYGFPFAETFDTNGLDCWGNFDEDGDGYSWLLDTGRTGLGAKSESFGEGGARNPDNWLISPKISLPTSVSEEDFELQLSWYVMSFSSAWPEHYGVYISSTGEIPADFTTKIYEGESTADFKKMTVSLMDYLGQTVRIAFRHYDSSNNWAFTIDDVEVDEYVPAPSPCPPITEFPYFNDFENFLDDNECWVSIDNDGDGHDWFTGTERYWNAAEQGADISGVDGSHCLISESYYDGAELTADNYVLSPELALPTTNDVILLSWYAAAQDPEWPDSYEVMIAPNGSTEINDFVSVYAGTGNGPNIRLTYQNMPVRQSAWSSTIRITICSI